MPMETGDREPEIKEPLIIPHISREDADKIIEGLNRQFEEKVLKKIRQNHPVMKEAAPPEKVPDFGLPVEEPGRSLQDYLSSVKTEHPEVPFADEDSQFDLSRLKTNGKPRGKN